MEHKTIRERLRWWAWKFCMKGEHENAASDAMTAGLERIEELEAALRELDDMIVDLDAGHVELHQVSRLIAAALAGGKATSDN